MCIVDREHAVQPWASVDGQWTINLNGEIFNHGDLRADLGPTRTLGDTEIALEAALAWGEDGLRRLRGEFALAIVETATRRVFLAHDAVGVKPLYWARHAGRLHVASEIKALVGLDATVHEVPPGYCGWADPGGDPDLHPFLDLYRLGLRDTDRLAQLPQPDRARPDRHHDVLDAEVGAQAPGVRDVLAALGADGERDITVYRAEGVLCPLVQPQSSDE